MQIKLISMRFIDQLPVGLLIGRALHRYRRGHGFKTRTGLKFFFFSGPIYNYSFQ